ncbi:hypothetical protein KR222_007181, partial [Zaprionus bogoriensis]
SSMPCHLASLIPKGNTVRAFSNVWLDTVDMFYRLYQQPHSQLKWPPILIMHGLNATRGNWRRSARVLAKNGPRIVIALQARNHGRSAHSPYHTPVHMANDVIAFMEKHQLSRIVALGHSMCGRSLMTLALTNPDLVERAIFVDITPGRLPRRIMKSNRILQAMLNVLPTIPPEFSLEEGRKFITPTFAKMLTTDLDLILIVFSLKKNADGTFGWKVNVRAVLDGWHDTVTHYRNTLVGLKPFPGETLLIASKRTKFVTSSNVRIMKKYFPNLSVKFIDAEHKIHVEQPEKFIDLVVNFTKNCSNC